MTNARGAKRPKGRTLAEFGKLSTAERKLLACAAAGEIAVFGNVRPESANDANKVRGEFIRFLALGGDEDAPVHEKGVQLQGAWIEGAFDLWGVESKGGLYLVNSTFEAEPAFQDARITGALILNGSEMPGLRGDRLTCDSSLFLRNKFVSTDEVRLLGAKIGSNFDCSDGLFDKKGKDALIADGIVVAGAVFLTGTFKATGHVRFVGAKIDSNFDCSGGTFENEDQTALNADRINVGGTVFMHKWFSPTGDAKNFKATGEVRLLAARIGGDLVFREGWFQGKQAAINIEGAHVDGALFIDSLTIQTGAIDLTGAKVSRLIDDQNSWKKGVILDGFVYGALGGKAPTDAKMRIGWLDKQSEAHSGKDGKGAEFRPQPWQQLRKVLREMGHYEAAREVGIAFERRKRECGLIGRVPEISVGQALRAVGGSVYGKTARLLHIGYGALVGYGYRPLRLLMIATVVWLVFGGGYFAAARWDGAFVPSTQALFSRFGGMCGLPAHVRWTDCKAIRLEYPQFYPLAYSLNVLLPVGNLGQEGTWRPETGTWGGRIAQFAVWFETLFGWMAGLILVAVVSGLAKRDE
ncbi:hypothetical protein ACMV_17430 [Acidiphilium multivorum AIU301]|uniref:Uncharacterized protein n=1 Tax=Acidiphilium multivorum (strain DSM 11245 / JCM 8867 / NBRC 100883 / AIU 301) TaxID=926570 RepID=F0IZ80_ACIMA|nr:hypothetical protein [Acidiphilium multivorum]BAJ81090.1 hypothetical protein ACMV_17430 [Acidiphilium multivorum AIU301]GAN75270.1 hypothetical protein Apmu_0309_06 [Acidiphilium multivorum AIU301]